MYVALALDIGQMTLHDRFWAGTPSLLSSLKFVKKMESSGTFSRCCLLWVKLGMFSKPTANKYDFHAFTTSITMKFHIPSFCCLQAAASLFRHVRFLICEICGPTAVKPNG